MACFAVVEVAGSRLHHGAIYGTTYPAIYGTISCSKNRLEHRGVGVGAFLFLLTNKLRDTILLIV